ncbi:hypothetical protein [Sandarakinorhabdus limnophila]|uniref:hypothetical protein n=1 Tax=Sandarakinorhabdus limnophila TaxID=210512 RepID=UPI0026F1B543|nr:hypothetical protein [Sandarakinorhabdus limnophila]
MPFFAIIGIVTVVALGLWLLSLVPGWAWLSAVAFVLGILALGALASFGEWLSEKAGTMKALDVWRSESADRALLQRNGIVGPPLWLPPMLLSKEVKLKLAELKRQT